MTPLIAVLGLALLVILFILHSKVATNKPYAARAKHYGERGFWKIFFRIFMH